MSVAQTESAAPMSLRAYARRRGCSAPSVLRAIARRRLTERSLVYIDGKAQIGNPDEADREWAENTDLSRAPSYVRERAQEAAIADGVTEAPVTPSPVTPRPRNGHGPTSHRVSPLTQASTNEKVWKGRLAELEYRRQAGELVEVAELAPRLDDMLTRIRTKLLAVPAKAKAQRPDLTLDQVAALDDLIREVLEDLASGQVLLQ